MHKTLLLTAAAITFGAGMVGASAHAEENGITDTTIKVGNTSPYSGGASAYGVIGKAMGAYFEMVNDNGGITSKDGKTRKVEYITLDDGYSPPRTVEQTRKLVEQDNVALILGSVGTPTNSAISRYMNARKVPQLFLGSGASKWGDYEKYKWSMGWQPTYDVEGAIYANYAMKELEEPKIAILFQNDDYGKDYRDGFLRALGDKADELVVKMLPYEVTDPTIESQIVSLANTGANVFFNITTPKFAAQAIRTACDIGWKPLHFLNNVSSSVGAVLKPAGLECSKDIVTAQYQKDPSDPQWADTEGFKTWSKFMDKYLPGADKSDVNYAFGHSAASLLHVTLEQCEDITRAGIMACATNLKDVQLPMIIPGVLVNTSPTDHYPIQAEQLSRFNGERWVLFGEIIDASK